MPPNNLALPAKLKYSREHIWIKKDGKEFIIGIDDYAQKQLQEVLYVDLPDVGSSYEKGQEFGTVESVKSVSPLIMPIQGKVIAVNTALDDNPELINSDCYGKAWIIRITTDALNCIDGLLNANEYRDYLDLG